MYSGVDMKPSEALCPGAANAMLPALNTFNANGTLKAIIGPQILPGEYYVTWVTERLPPS